MRSPGAKLLSSGIFFFSIWTASPGGFAFCAVSPSVLAQSSSRDTPPAAGPNRPAAVPDGYVVTPFGYFHPSCFRALQKGERLLADGRVQNADGTIEETAAACNYPRYTASGGPLTTTSAKLSTSGSDNTGVNTSPEVNGWIENASITTGEATKSFGALVALWRVPPQPTANDGQTLFFFTGFEDINATQSILQPVLQWYGGQWAVASWNCCLNNIVTESPVVNVRSGDEIYSSITSTCPQGTLSCSTWNVLSLDMSTGDSTTLDDTPSEGQVFNWAFGAVMEPYGVISCDDYPPNRRITFDDVTVFDEHLHPIFDPHWIEALNTTQTPQCNYGVKSKLDKIALDY
jgi:hypothetical protein